MKIIATMYSDQEFETNFGSDMLNSECILPSGPSAGNATELRPGDVDLKAYVITSNTLVIAG